MIQEFVKELINRLKEYAERYDEIAFAEMNENGQTLDFEYARGKTEATKEIAFTINQLAEEYNNDFCEWFKYDYRTIAPKHHDNIWAISENLYWRYGGKDAHIKFCPYCGKKIKVVEAKGE